MSETNSVASVLEILEYMGKTIKNDALESFRLRHEMDPQRPIAARYGRIGAEIEAIVKDLRACMQVEAASLREAELRGRAAGRAAERAAFVRWLRTKPHWWTPEMCAERVESGAHLEDEDG